MKYCRLLLGLSALFASLLASHAATASVRMLTQNRYLPGIPVLVRVEGYTSDGARDRETWDSEAILSVDGLGITLSTNRIQMRNGMGSALVTFTGGSTFNLFATVGGVSVSRQMQNAQSLAVTKIGGTLSGGSSTWSGIINVTNDLIITNHVLTIASNTLVLMNGVGSGAGGADIIVNANASIQSLGTELHPVTITCSNSFITNRWGQIRHNNSLASFYRHTFINRAGRAPGEGHTGQAPAVRSAGSTLTFESSTLSDLCETTFGAPGFGTPGKAMYAVGSTLTMNDCLLQRARSGPEIEGTALLFTNSYVMDMRGPDDSDGIYLHSQQAGQTIKLVDSVFADGDDDGIDTLGSTITVESCILRNWASTIEDAKAISVFDGFVDIRHCLITDCTVGVAAKTTSSARVAINNSTIANNATNVLAAYKANAPGPVVELRITNSILTGGNPIHSDFDPASPVSTNFIIRYTDTGEAWAGTGNIASDALFVNAAARNFRLRVDSPCINAGNPASPTDVDGSAADMGYFPFLTNPDPLIAFGATWRYLDNGTDQGTAWSQRSFNDITWASGPAQLGYSSNPAELDEATTVSFGADPNNKYITTYFRRAFTVLNPSEFTNAAVMLTVDDGAVVYLNGQELFRTNMDSGPILYNTLANAAGENSLFAYFFSPTLLSIGTNVIAVEVHQLAVTSSDLSFDLSMAGYRAQVSGAPTVAIASPLSGASFTTPATIPVTVNANDSDGTITSVQLYQNGALLYQTNASPLSFNWQGVPVGSYTLTAVATDNSGNSQTSAPVIVTVSNPSTTTTNNLIALGSTWRYLDNGTDQGTSWSQPTFNDSSWLPGTAPLGYCTTACSYGIVTTVSFGPDSLNKYITTYFRRFFNVANASRVQGLRLGLLRDDGVVIYINGTEVWRTNMPLSTVNYLTPASSASNYPFEQTALPASALAALTNGTNIIAVEVHQGSVGSSDVALDLQLDGIMAAATNETPIVNITAPANGSTFPAPLSTTITANAVDIDGTVTNVAFYANGVKLVDDTSSPFSAAWNSVPAGNYSLIAVATDNVGLVATSSVVNVTVSTNTAAPIVFSKNPAPGSLTNLTQLTVTFSKVVQGVNASDLLVNGVPASGISGSGSNYTFTFAQPAFGNVAITWATAHGITDTFTPAVAFNTNSTGANWSYTLLDAVPPTITTIDPTPNSTIAALTSISVTFSEPVTGVNAADLLVNSAPTTGLSGSGAGPYTFTFVQPPQGVVQVSWAGGHGIQDTSANPFSPAPWSYTLDTNSSGVLISEIMYHPSTENVLEEYIELFNKGASAVNLNGWQFSGGVNYTFTNASIPAGGYLVVAANLDAFLAKYPGVTNVVGNWTGVLNNDSEDIDLDDAQGNRADSVEYADEGEWAVRQRGFNDQGFRGWTWFKPHDGGGSSLELINPNLSNNEGQNWAASTDFNGTPGRVNSVYQNNIAPLILEATHFPIIPRSTDLAIISARILDEAAGGLSVGLSYRVSLVSPPPFTNVVMHDDGLNGDAAANDGLWSARLPALGNDSVVEYYISASDAQNRTRTWPAAAIAAIDLGGPTGQVANALFQIDNEVYTNSAPLYKMVLTAGEHQELGNLLASASGFNSSDAAMNCTFISVDGVETLLRYQCSVRNRGHGSRIGNPHNYRVGFTSDHSWKDLAAINLNARVTYAQTFGATIARRSGVEGGNSRAVRLRINGGAGLGGTPTFDHYAANEDVGSDWARNHFPDDDNGNVYKVVRDILPPNFDYRGTTPAAYQNTYFKESNVSENNWTDLIGMLEVMGENRTNLFTNAGARSVINVEQWLRHLAVMSLLGNGESGLTTGNNDDYYLYAGVNDPRFILIYHDLDQILGQGGSLATSADIFRATCCPVSGDSEGTWRAMNWFMHQPEFEALYYRTLQDLLDTTFSATQFNALLDHTLGSYVPTSTTDSMKTWMNARRSYVQSVITGLVPPATNSPVATVSGEPRSPSPFTTATLRVGGESIVSYSYRLNNGAWSAEIPVGAPISLASLPQGSTNTIYVVGKNSGGIFQSTNTPTISETWVVNTNTPRVRLNEVLASNNGSVIHAGTTPDAIELFNEGTTTVNLNGYRLTDDKGSPSKFTFGNVNLTAGAYLIVYANNDDLSGGIHTGFTLDPDGDQVYLFDRATNGNVVLDSVKFGMQITDLSIGRLGSAGDWALTAPTFGSLNVTQALGNQLNLRINEWLAAAGLGEDFIELYNPNNLPTALGGLYLTDTPVGAPALNRINDLSFIGANSFLSFTADGNGDPANHVNFQLPSEQGEIALLTANLKNIDCIAYGPQTTGISQGKCPNGGATYATLSTPTPGAPNSCPFVPPPPTTVTLLTISNSWRYQPRTNYDAVNWTTNSYNDSTWPSGLALLGRQSFASNQIWPEPFRTHIETNLTQTNFYFRAHFNVAAGVTYNSLSFRHIIDDGAVFYLNGVEIPGSRFNMPGGAVNGAVFALSTTSVGSYVGPVNVPVSMLVTGDNVFAVSVHQSANNSSDVAMGVELNAFIVTNSPASAGVLINEVLANNMSVAEPDGSTPDWVELYNPSSNAVDLADMSLTDNTTLSRRWVFPAGSILPALSYMKVRFDGGLPSSTTNTGFGLSANGGSVFLFNRIADGGGLLNSISYGLQAADFSIGRVPNGSANWVLTTPTGGGPNLSAALGNVSLLKINEWMANPVSGADDYFEIFNPNTQPVDISQFYLTDDLSVRTKHQLPALSFIGIGQNSFQLFVADGNTVNGSDHVNFSLRAAGEALGISTSAGTLIDSVSFGNQSSGVSQGRLPDGGATIVSFTTTASPGKSNFLPLNNIVVNELLAHTDLPVEDAVEFYNTTGDDVDISGWYLSDSQNDLLKYRIPTNTIVRAGSYVVFYEYQFNGEGTLPFSFSSAKGDEVYLSQSTNAGTLTGYRAFATFDASENGVSFGRFRTSVGNDFTAMSARSFGVDNPTVVGEFRAGAGLTNPYPKVGPVVINEIMYHPAISNDALEFIELRNVTASAIALFDTNNPGNTWRLRKGIDFNFPGATTIPAGGYLVVVSFDPAVDLTAKADFTSAYGTNMTLVGPYIGKLDNSGEALELQKPDAPQTAGGDIGLVPYIVADRVVYADLAPWPTTPDGFGDSLKKTTVGLYGNEPLNWQGGTPNPGAANFASSTNTPPTLNAIADRSVHKGFPLTFTATATDPDLPAQTLFYSIDAPVPSGATIGSGSGIFNWTPATNQATANYNVTVRVTDNGVPALSDTRTFQIAVLNLPKVSSVQVTNGMVTVRWESFAGRRYRLETTLNLTTPNWQPLGSDVVATGTSTALTFSIGADPQRFYRIISYDN
jgi:hypothetical protein